MLRILLCVFLTFSLLPSVLQAGSSEAGAATLPADQVAAFSNRVQSDLAARGAYVAIVARQGRDPAKLPRGVKYTHVGFWVFSLITRADGSKVRGYRVYNLYQDNENKQKSSLVQGSPADFFAAAHELDAGIIIPDLRLQKKLLKVISSPTYAALHNTKYSVLANPNTSQFQNCTEHTLDVVMASLYQTKDVRQIKASITAHFEPQEIQVNGFKRLFAAAASKALTTADHGSRVKTATFQSIARFMRDHDLISEVYRLTPTKALRL